MITLTHAGYIKRQPADTYTAQHRGGKGLIGMTTKEEDYIEKVVAVDSHSQLMLFTNLGKVYVLKAYRIPEAGRTAKGSYITNVIELSEGEKVTAMISVRAFPEEEYLTMVTRQGVMKRTSLSEFSYQRKGGKMAIRLDEGDELLFVVHTKGGQSVLIATRQGMSVRFDEENVRIMGRGARGVRGIRLSEGDYVVGAVKILPDTQLVTITERGYGKRTLFDDFREMKNRGGSGVSCHHLSEKTGDLAGICAAEEGDDLMLITDQGTIIRTPVADINTYSRTASGVIVMRLEEGQRIVNLTRVETHPEGTDGTQADDGTEPDAGNDDADGASPEEIIIPELEE